MKTVQKFLVALLLLLFVSSFITSQAADFTREITGYRTMGIKKQIYPNDTYSLFTEATIHYGADIPSDPTEAKVLIRSIWDFTFPTGLTTGSYPKKVELKWNTNSSQSFNLGYVSDYPSNPDLQQKWDLTENAVSVGTLAGSNGYLFTQEVPDLLQYLQQAYDQGKTKAYLSFRASSELMNTDLVEFSQLTLKITYEVRVKYNVENNFLEGQLKVNNEPKNSGESVYLISQTSNNFEAIEPQTSSSDIQYVWNDTEAPLNKSKWDLEDLNGIKSSQGETMILPHTAVTGENNYTMIANLRQNFAVSRNDKTDAGTLYNQQTFYIVEQNNGPVSAPAQVGGISNYVGWTDNLAAPNPRVISPTGNETYTALYKASRLSNNADTYTSNGQRKFVNLNGTLFSVYESSGYVWLERSTNNGSTWEILNNNKPIGNAAGRYPTMDYNPSGDMLVIAYKDNSGNKYAVYHRPTNTFRYGTIEFPFYPEPPGGENPEFVDYEPLSVAWNGNSNALFIINANGIFYYAICYLSQYTTSWLVSGEFGTGVSGSPTLASTKVNVGSSWQYFHFAYQKNSNIYYRRLRYITSFVTDQEENISSTNGFSNNYQPTIIEINNEPRICWIAYRKFIVDGPGGEVPIGETKVFYKGKVSGNWSVYNSYGNSSINSVNINRNNDNTFALAWSEGTSNVNKFVRSDNLAAVYTTNTTGKFLQVCNYANLNSMRLNSYYTSSIPYSFLLSNTFSTIPQDEEAEREGIIVQDTTAFYFSLGEIKVDNESISFTEIPDTFAVSNQENLNSNLISEPFDITENSIFTYGIKYGVTDSVSAAASLSNGKTVNFKVQLIDNQTGEVLGTLDDVTFNEQNIIPFESMAYQVNTQGIENKTCKLKIITEDNLNFAYSLRNSYNNESMLAKKGFVKKTLSLINKVESYDLAQNYPNPFNPSTIIKYQIPENGVVTLKIYDILGKEVKTLVNEQKTKGRYEINFDATNLASGVYVYRIQVNDPQGGTGFVSVKKMMLLK